MTSFIAEGPWGGLPPDSRCGAKPRRSRAGGPSEEVGHVFLKYPSRTRKGSPTRQCATVASTSFSETNGARIRAWGCGFSSDHSRSSVPGPYHDSRPQAVQSQGRISTIWHASVPTHRRVLELCRTGSGTVPRMRLSPSAHSAASTSPSPFPWPPVCISKPASVRRARCMSTHSKTQEQSGALRARLAP